MLSIVRLPWRFLLPIAMALLLVGHLKVQGQGLNFFRIQESNDIFSSENDDRYFTQGLKFEIMGTAIGSLYKTVGLRRLLVKMNNDSLHKDHYSILFTQDFYTPSNSSADTVVMGDRPFAGTMFATFRNVSVSSSKFERVMSEISIGVLGPAALGKQMQRGVHSLINNDAKIVGWDYQLHNDLYLNYLFHLENGIFSSKYLEANSIYEFNLGTVYDDFGIGGRMRVGLFKGFFDRNLGLTTRQDKFDSMGRMIKGAGQFYVFFNPLIKLVLYNALLQGGVINNIINTKEYRMTENQLSRFVVDGNYGFGMIIGRCRLELIEYFRSKEFEGGYNHRYGNLVLTYSW